MTRDRQGQCDMGRARYIKRVSARTNPLQNRPLLLAILGPAHISPNLISHGMAAKEGTCTVQVQMPGLGISCNHNPCGTALNLHYFLLSQWRRVKFFFGAFSA